MDKFRFAIMGAGKIAVKFCEAVGLLEDCEVAAVASKSAKRAERFADANHVGGHYDSYERMLVEEKPDCVYIAVTPDAHYELSMLCLKYKVPVLCEKAMFLNSAQAEEVFARARETGVFVMEAMWSRFLPTVKKVREWIDKGKIGKLSFMDISIGFLAAPDPESRFLNAALGGGAAFDVTVYVYEIADFYMHRKPDEVQVAAVWGPTGVDVTDHVVLRYGDVMASLTGSFAADLDGKAVIYGDGGKIVMAHPHHGSEAFLYPSDGGEAVYFHDTDTQNGFVYEIQEAMDCIRAGKVESEVVPHSLTLDCARLFDRIMMTNG